MVDVSVSATSGVGAEAVVGVDVAVGLLDVAVFVRSSAVDVAVVSSSIVEVASVDVAVSPVVDVAEVVMSVEVAVISKGVVEDASESLVDVATVVSSVDVAAVLVPSVAVAYATVVRPVMAIIIAAPATTCCVLVFMRR